MAEKVRTGPIVAVLLVAASVLAVALVLEVALRIEERIRLDPALVERLPRPEPKAREPGEIRILALGDSFTRGIYLAGEDAFPARLEQKLRGSGVPATVFNLGIPGTNTVDQLAQAGSELPAFEPDVVLLGYYANDIERSRAERVAEVEFGEQEDRSRRLATHILRWRNHSHLLRFLSPRLAQLLARLGIELPGAIEYAPRLDAVYRENRPRFVVMQNAMLELDALCRESDTRLLVLVFPAMAPFGEGYPLPDYHRTLVEFCLAHGIDVLDLLPAFEGRDPSRLQVSLLDAHPNEVAHEIFAAAIAAHLLASAAGEIPVPTED